MATQPLWGTPYDMGQVTPDDLLSLQDDGMFTELWKGQVVRTEMTSISHGFLANKLGMLLSTHLQSIQIPALVAQHALFDLTQPGQSRTVLAPDVALVLASSLPSTIAATYIPVGGPWLAIEILSPKQTLIQMRLKAQAYLAAGTVEVWIIEPTKQTIETITASGRTTFMAQQQLVSTILPQFTETVHNLVTI